jgi:regulator of protease activity HflC (stomatin/prohibitin superfamily)
MTVSDSRVDAPDTETLLRRVIDILGNCRTLPLSSSVKLDNKDEVVELLEEATARLPDELRAARWMLKERQEYLDKTQRDGDDILEAARIRAERMVQRTEIVREAQHTARRAVEDARDESRRLRLEAEDYCDQKLAAFEIVLERTIKTVHAGRDKLSATPGSHVTGPHSLIAGVDQAEDTLAGEDTFFDQDRL